MTITIWTALVGSDRAVEVRVDKIKFADTLCASGRSQGLCAGAIDHGIEQPAS